MSHNGRTQFKNAANAARFSKCVSDHFGALCIKGLRLSRNYQLDFKSEKKAE